MSIDHMVPCSPADLPLTSRRAELDALEAIITENLDSEEKAVIIAEAITVIYEYQHYRTAGYKYFSAYVKGRWHKSRAWAYQRIRFALERRAAALAGQPIPATERQSRTVRAGAEGAPFEERWPRVFKFLKKQFLFCPPQERERFVQMLELMPQFFMNWALELNKEAQQDEDENQTADP